jgi:hypothetical protein
MSHERSQFPEHSALCVWNNGFPPMAAYLLFLLNNHSILMKIALDKRGRFVPGAFTLVEVLVAVVIIGTLFVTLFLGISFCFSVTKFERENLRATQIILQRMEGIRLFNWNQLTDTNYNPTAFEERYFPGSGAVAANGIKYTGSVMIAPLILDPPASYSGNMKKITVTVQWASGNVVRSRSGVTYVARDGIQNYIYGN